MEALHFLRPLWFLAIPVIAFIWWRVRRARANATQLGNIVAAHLRDALTINRGGTAGIRPIDGAALTMIILTIATAGPTWSKQISPWFEETAPLVVAVEVTDSMRANDLMPTRLDRARFKVLDLIAERTASRTALIAYAGSAHLVMPPSTDSGVLKLFLESLDPGVMPRAGTAPATVLPLARTLLGDETAGGTVLFVNDGFDGADPDQFAAFAAAPSGPSLAALVLGTVEGGVALKPDGTPVTGPGGGPLNTTVDETALGRFGRSAAMSVVRATPGDADLRTLQRTLDSNLRQAQDADAQWLDRGWWFLWPAVLLAAAWFRRGWTMRW